MPTYVDSDHAVLEWWTNYRSCLPVKIRAEQQYFWWCRLCQQPQWTYDVGKFTRRRITCMTLIERVPDRDLVQFGVATDVWCRGTFKDAVLYSDQDLVRAAYALGGVEAVCLLPRV